MRTFTFKKLGMAVGLLVGASLPFTSVYATPQGTAFTYQGQLMQNNGPVTGNVDMVFKLFDAAAAGTQIGTTVTINGVAVEKGLFTVPLDFPPGFFAGVTQERWLEVTIAGTPLAPRTKIESAPYALQAQQAEVLSVDYTCAAGQFMTGLLANGTAQCAIPAGGGGGVTNIATGAGLTGGPITTTGTISVANDGITSTMILNGTVALADLAADSVNSSKIVDGSVAFGDLANNSVGGAKIVDGSIGAADLGNNAVVGGTGGVISDGSITSADINTASVQARSTVAGENNCTGTQKMTGITQAGAVVCAADVDTNSGGDVTDVIATFNGGLQITSGSAGPIPSVGIAPGGVIGTMVANDAITINNLNIGSCPAGQYMMGVTDGAPNNTLNCVTAVTGVGVTLGEGLRTTISGVPGTTVISGAGSIGIAPDGVVTSMIKDGEVKTADIGNGEVKTANIGNGEVKTANIGNGEVKVANIDTTTVQGRVFGTCAIGDYLRGINQDGSVVCVPIPGGPNRTVGFNTAASDGTHTSVTLGTDGLPVISYFDATLPGLRVAHCANVACTAFSPTTPAPVRTGAGGLGQFNSIAIASDGFPIISYKGLPQLGAGDALEVIHCTAIDCSTTSAPGRRATSEPVLYTAIAVPPDGIPVIAHYDNSNFDLKFTRCFTADCANNLPTPVSVDTVGNVGQFVDIAIGTDNFAIISYFDSSNTKLKTAHCGNAACSVGNVLTTVDTASLINGRYTSIAIGSDGLPIISYLDGTNTALKVAHCTNSTCSASALAILDNTGSVGQFTSIAIGADGFGIISYYDVTNSSLKVAHCTTAACGAAALTTVDNAADVGQYSSIVIGADKLPFISYSDVTNNNLKVTWCGTADCQ